MRLGVLGPADGDVAELARAAQTLVDRAAAERVIYLGADDALDRVVLAWAQDLVGPDASERALFDRAADACPEAPADQINAFVERERARRRLRIFANLPPAPGRTIELLDGRVAVLLFDKANLDEDDIAGASILVFGRSRAPILKRVGARVFVSPGPVGCEGGGSAVLDDEDGGIRVTFYGPTGEVSLVEQIGKTTTKMTVRGD